jgi:lipopolysaccharide/colanic/teichoic acid biosynthesis glycosyltransferase
MILFFILISERSLLFLKKFAKKKSNELSTWPEYRRTWTIQDILTLTRVYGIAFAYPKFLPDNVSHVWKEYIVSWIPIIEMQSVSLGFWWLLIKRSVDIFVSFIGIIVLSPLLILVAIIIKIEDPSWPIIFKNRRIWKWWKPFELYKFRYMYWRYSVKDAYGIDAKDDTALKFEESLKSWHDSRSWPLYKIENDPRKTKFWKIIERLSIDEIPQLINVLKGDMSIIWPRPHQPREVELYDEEDTQVLTIKPGITGMAQVYGREKNSFKQEVALDRYYIENYSILLDILIFFRTFFVILTRIFQK